MEQQHRRVEICIVISTDMDSPRLDEFAENIAEEVKAHLIEDEEVLAATWTEKISYKSTQAIQEK